MSFTDEIFVRKMRLFLLSQISQVIGIIKDLVPLTLSAGVELMIASQNLIESFSFGQVWGLGPAPHPL